MNNPNEQFVASPTFYDLENIIETKVELTDSYQALVTDLQKQNQQLTEKLIAALEENAKLREQLFTNKGLAKVSLPTLPIPEGNGTSNNLAIDPYTSQILMTSKSRSEMLNGYASPF
jgi:hypothetical protein